MNSREVKRLHDLGFALLWLNGKRPVEQLKATYKKGMNIGVRTGEASKIGENYLAVIDVDVKTEEFKPKALKKIREILNGVKCPLVLSGSGGGSRHYYCVTKEPFKMITALKIKDEGEICIYSTGRQMVLPPSKTTNEYTWAVPLDDAASLPLLNFDSLKEEKHGQESKDGSASKADKRTGDSLSLGRVSFTPVDLSWLPISDRIRSGIQEGTDVNDRSAFLLPAATALLSAGLSRDEILSVLTDKDTFLGACAFEHAKTSDRQKAAEWVWKYSLRKVMSERSAVEVFKDVAIEAPKELSEKELEAQSFALEALEHWTLKLERSGPKGSGPYKSTIENIVMILKNDIAENLFERNVFSFRDTYGVDAPWGAKRGDVIADDDVPKIKLWLGVNFGFEPGKEIIHDAMTIIACDNAFDPVKDWLDELPEWDGKDRISGWLQKNFGASGNDEYVNQVFRKWLVAMVMRVYEPGAKFDWMPIFEGVQGGGKSSFGRLLVGDKFFLDWLPNLADKDSALSLQGMWGVEMGELSQFRKNELEVIKGFITRTVDKVRPPFGKRWVENARRCVFFGTTNKDKYLRDDTGNRRFKPVQVGALNFHALEEDRIQLFSQAKWLYDNFVETPWTMEMSGEAKLFETTMHIEKMTDDDSHIMVEQIREYVDLARNGGALIEGFDTTKFKIHGLFSGIGPLKNWRLDNRNMQFAAKALKALGGQKWKTDGQIYWKLEGRDRFQERPVPLDFF
jgi:predicted P-loop ATPase